MRTDEGKALAFALARQADVVVESFRPGVLRHLGLDYDSLWEVHPSVIYCSVTGYGQSGEMFQLGGNDLNYQAVSGFLSAFRDAEGKPVISDIPLADYAVGLYACEQVCAALVQRSRTGRGAYLDVASGDLLSSWVGLHAILSKRAAPKDYGMMRKGLLAYEVYETADGHYVALAALEERFWHNFCRAVGRHDWENLHHATALQQPQVHEELKALFLSRTQFEWSELGIEVDCCLTAVEELENWSESLYVTSREIAYTLPYLERKEAPASMPSSPAWHADHTHDLLRKKLHVSDAELSRLQKLGVIPASSS
ncbi:CaiB/BaiF CoA transferase family protein [Brevibacillus choshinensis]|uniref:CaiB/BaiF CoA transferase family protein n=1 Tax=Brevibacillus choshinensis TaxID=54911 RepID=UPI0023B12C97|nr:CoA transferase [Brevibacillus choshinensis]